VQVYPGLAVSLLGGADANTQQVKASDGRGVMACLSYHWSHCAFVVTFYSKLSQALLLLQQRGLVAVVDGGWKLRAAAAL
jgi:hypothetical protein